MLSKHDIAAHVGVMPTRDVHVPEWANDAGDDTVRIRSLSTREFELHQQRMARQNNAKNKADKADANAFLLAKCLVGEDGLGLFNPSDEADLRQLGELPVGGMLKVVKAINELCGFDDLDDDVDGAVEDAVGKSEPTPNDDSASN